MFTATYAESVISTPIWAIGEPRGPMLNGTTYIVRPFIEPANRWCRVAFISAGSAQLLVGPASCAVALQINVLSSTRATSLGSERARKLFGRSALFNLVKVPDPTSCSVRWSYSPWEPSHQCTAIGSHSSAIAVTQSLSCWCRRLIGKSIVQR